MIYFDDICDDWASVYHSRLRHLPHVPYFDYDKLIMQLHRDLSEEYCLSDVTNYHVFDLVVITFSPC